ncbi:hypothetical protein SAMN02745116_01631 [Pilibacter termitis]|uniref:Uncharacterized protein n=1 Tax=Pilibacter termitis TaxID=263852 RepID=A0A1T4P447_9ENTE|nr:hypothetical protein [Pilibacter termitis]SJZ86026.1 hypothetical protein SAMN02745116_01631 [Pilibacter termitis]
MKFDKQKKLMIYYFAIQLVAALVSFKSLAKEDVIVFSLIAFSSLVPVLSSLLYKPRKYAQLKYFFLHFVIFSIEVLVVNWSRIAERQILLFYFILLIIPSLVGMKICFFFRENHKA